MSKRGRYLGRVHGMVSVSRRRNWHTTGWRARAAAPQNWTPQPPTTQMEKLMLKDNTETDKKKLLDNSRGVGGNWRRVVLPRIARPWLKYIQDAREHSNKTKNVKASLVGASIIGDG